MKLPGPVKLTFGIIAAFQLSACHTSEQKAADAVNHYLDSTLGKENHAESYYGRLYQINADRPITAEGENSYERYGETFEIETTYKLRTENNDWKQVTKVFLIDSALINVNCCYISQNTKY
jgi:hypothetical protein